MQIPSTCDDFRKAPEKEIYDAFEHMLNSGHVQEVSEDKIVNRGDQALKYGRVRKVSEHVLVKRCSASEYKNQSFAWTTLDQTRIRVPEPLRYLTDPDDVETGYLFMEFLDGCTWEHYNDPHIDTSVLEATRYMHDRTISIEKHRLLPGTIDRRPAEGFPWGDKPAEQVCNSLMELTECLNKRLWTRRRRKTDKELPSVALEGRDLVLCHLDLAPRNWVILKNGQVALLDWEYLCLYPVIFELAGLSMRQIESPDEKQEFLLSALTMDECSRRLSEEIKEETRDEIDQEISDQMKKEIKDEMKALRIVNVQSISHSFD